ncbi:SRPBCC family protein [Streptomyces sp. SID6648]|nr:SRPBCC family protein [Streptomyces sp. SID6648]
MYVVVRGSVAGRVASVWGRFAAFGDIAQWHPLIEHSALEEGLGPAGGPVRVMGTQDGGIIREELLVSDAAAWTLSYLILDSPFPVSSYRAVVQLSESAVPEQCDIVWSADFEPNDPADGPGLSAMFGEKVFEAGIAALDGAVEAL